MVESNINLQEVFDELQKDALNPEIIQDNKLHFQIADALYRVRMPNQKDLAEANERRNQKYIELIQQPNTLTLKKLIKILKENQNIDIEAMESAAKELENQLIDLHLSLAKRKDSEQQAIDKYKENIEEIRAKRIDIVLEKAGYLSPAIENQAQDSYYKYLTAICTEKYQENVTEKITTGDWSRVWNNWTDYEKDESKLAYVALGRLTELTLSV